ncbi:unnamed protein product [Ixodes hexagonus]
MVLRKSEYRKNFKWISADKRHALWLENALYRHDRRLREFCHQPLGWDSDPDDVPDSESEDCGLPPTKLRQRRLQLLEITGHQQQAHDPSHRRTCREKHKKQVRKSTYPLIGPRKSLHDSRLHDVVVTPNKTRDVVLRHTLLRRRRQTHTHTRRHTGTGGVPWREELRTHCPSHGPFENYGWADEVDTVSAKRTFNVAASTTEVYPSALTAARLRHRSPTPPPKRKTFRPQRPRSAPPKAHHHVWISEYRDQYQ